MHQLRDKRDTRKKRFTNALTAQGTVYHAAQAAGVSRQTAYRWRDEDQEFAFEWEQALENAVDGVENALYKRALAGEVIPAIFYLKAHRPIYRDRLNINVEQVKSEIEERIAQLREHADFLPRAIPMLTD